MLKIAAPSRIIVARLDSIGDCVLSSSFFAGLRRLFPAAHITAALSALTAPLFSRDPAFDRVVAIPPGPSSGWRTLIDPPYDVAICPRWDVDYWSTRELALMSQAPVRLGFDRGNFAYDDATDGWTGAYFTNLVCTQSGIHEVLKDWDMLSYLGLDDEYPSPRLFLPDEAVLAAANWLMQRGLKHFGVLAVAAGGANRIWPRENFLPVIDTLAAERGLKFIVVGGPDASETGGWLANMRPDIIYNAGGEIPLTVSAALLARAAIYIGMDTGLMHVASAAGVPVVEISCHPHGGDPQHRNSPQRFGPFSPRQRVLQPDPIASCATHCSVSHSPHCITRIHPSEVTRAAADLLAT